MVDVYRPCSVSSDDATRYSSNRRNDQINLRKNIFSENLIQNFIVFPGEPLRYDPTFKGPLKGRSCTDVICLFLFVAFMGGWGFVSYYGKKWK